MLRIVAGEWSISRAFLIRNTQKFIWKMEDVSAIKPIKMCCIYGKVVIFHEHRKAIMIGV